MTLPAAIADVLAAYPERYRPLGSEPPAHAGFSAAVVVRVETPAGAVCLRGWPPEKTDLDRVRGLHRLLAHLRQSGIEFVAVPLPSSDGRTLVLRRGRWWQVEPWLPGRADFSTRPGAARLQNAARALARLHQAARAFEPLASEHRWFSSHPAAAAPAVEERLQIVGRWTSDELARLRAGLDRMPRVAAEILATYEACAALVEHELRAAVELRVPVQPCFRDVWHDHLLFEADAVAGIIDPSAARTDTIAADLSRLFGSLVADDRHAWDVALAAYQDIRPLSPAERMLVGVLDRSGTLLSGMAWLARFAEAGEPAGRDRIEQRLEAINRRLHVIVRTAT